MLNELMETILTMKAEIKDLKERVRELEAKNGGKDTYSLSGTGNTWKIKITSYSDNAAKIDDIETGLNKNEYTLFDLRVEIDSLDNVVLYVKDKKIKPFAFKLEHYKGTGNYYAKHVYSATLY